MNPSLPSGFCESIPDQNARGNPVANLALDPAYSAGCKLHPSRFPFLLTFGASLGIGAFLVLYEGLIALLSNS
jgi:hypothetical protein